MNNSNLKRWLVLGTAVITCAAVMPVVSQTVESEMQRIVSQLGLFVPEKIVDGQASQLSVEFRNQFRTKPQLNTQNVQQYFTAHPTEVMAFRAYIQQLTDIGVINGESAESLVITAFQALEKPIKQQILAGTIIRNTATQRDASTQTLELQASQIKREVSKTDVSRSADVNTIDFGESLDRDQKASLAAQELKDKIEDQKRIERNKMLARALIDEFSQGKPSPESLGRRVERIVTQFAEVESKKQTETLLDNVKISVTSIRNGPEYEVRGLKAFDNINPNYFGFTEFGLTSDEEDTTVNIGLGVRRLSEDKTLMGGLNAFYDQEAGSGHKRGSVGIELVSAPFRFNANRYYALSDGKALTALQTEKPMDGHDVDLELALPYLPGLFAGYNQSTWNGEDGIGDLERKSYRLKGNLSKNLSVEVGKRTYSSSIDDQNTAKISYNYIFGADSDAPTIIDMDTQPYRYKKIGPHERYKLVERENKIVTQVSQAGLKVTFTGL